MKTRNRNAYKTGLLASVLLPFAMVPSLSGAQVTSSGETVAWIGDESDDWFTSLNWDDKSVPKSDDDVLIDSTVSNDTIVSDGQSNGTAKASLVIVGNESSGSLGIQDGGIVDAESLVVGSSSGGSGELVVSGSDSSDNASTLTVNDLLVGASGNGQLVLSTGGVIEVDGGDGKLVIASETGSTGKVVMSGGTLNADEVAFGSGDGSFTVLGTNSTIASKFSGNGSFLVEAGTAKLSGDSSDFTGTTSVGNSSISTVTTLSVSGKLGGSVTVNAGAILAGTGSFTGQIVMERGSTIAVGEDETLNVNDITFESGSTYDMKVNFNQQPSTASLISASGDVVINGGTVDITNAQDIDMEEGTWVIITGETVTGEFDRATNDNTSFLQYSFSYSDTTATLKAEFDSFSNVAETPNQFAVTAALDSLEEANSSHPIVRGLLGSITDAEAVEFFNRLTGEGAPSFNGALIENGQLVVQTINNRFQQVDAGAAASTFGFSNAAAANGSDLMAWVTPFGQWTETDSTGNTAAMDNRVLGIMAGLEGQVSEFFQLGVVAGYYNTDIDVDSLEYSANSDSAIVGAYGGVAYDAFSANAGALYSWHSIDSERTTAFPVTETVNADYNAHSWQLFAEASYSIPVARANLMPFAGVSHINLKTDSFREKGASTALNAEAERTQTTFTTLGLRSSVPIFENGQFHGMAGWRHAFGDVNPETSYTIDVSDPFTIYGAPIAKDVFVTEAGFSVLLYDNLNAKASYQGQFGGGETAHGATATVSLRF